MPLPVLAQLGIAAAPSILNGISTAITNRQQKKFAEKQYATQRADNLQDWKTQNEYNSPISQMTRLNEAGLNPNLIYKGGATNQAGEISRAQFGSYNPQAPKFEMDLLQSLSQYQNYQNQQIVNDNLKQDGQIKEAQKRLIEANLLKTLKGTDKLTFDIARGQSLLGYQADAAKANIRNINARTDVLIDSNKRNWILAANKPEETLARIMQLRAQTSKVPFEKQILEQNATRLRTENYFLGSNLAWKKEMNKALHEGLIQKNLNLGKQGTGIDIQNQMNRIRTQLLENDIPLKYVDRFIKLIGTVTPF
jgi:hypothetical protein